MYQNQTRRDPTPAELAALKALLAPDANHAPTGDYQGFTPAAIAAALAAPRTVANPAPTVGGSIDRLMLLDALISRSSMVQAVPPTETAPITFADGTQGQMTAGQFQASYAQKIAYLSANASLTVPVTPDLMADFSLAVAFKVFALEEIKAFLPVVTIDAGPLAFQVVGSESLPEAADITAALES